MKNSQYFPFERNNYYYGKLLSVEDFNLEQKYGNDKRRTLNRFLNGSGIIAGMQVVSVDDQKISVERGIAIDPMGREVVIDAPVIKKLSILDGFDSCIKSGNDSFMYLCAEYAESAKGSVGNIASDDSEGESFNRIREGYRLFLTNDEPKAEIVNSTDLYKERQCIYWDGKMRITQIIPRFVNSGSKFELKIEIENLDKQYAAFSYDLLLTCFSFEEKNTLKVNFDEMLFEKTGKYEISYTLTALDISDIDGTAEITPESFRLTLGKLPLETPVKGKSTSHITKNDIRNELIKSCYNTSLDDIIKDDPALHLYLAKIFLIKAGDTYVIENVENVPFNQYIMNARLSDALNRLMIERPAGTSAAAAPAFSEQGSTKSENSARDIASGVCRLFFNNGGQKRERFFSEEIIHTLGLGSVTLILSVSDSGQMTYGSSEVFERTDPQIELAARLNPAKGSFVIGGRLISTTTKDYVDIKWTAIRDVDEIVTEKTKMKIFIKPNSLTLKTRESFYLEVICSNMPDKTIQWSVADNCGMIDNNGMYVAPNVPGVYEVIAQSAVYPQVKASIMVVVRD